MSYANRLRFVLVTLTLVLGAAETVRPQVKTAPNAQPNPYRTMANWAQLPAGRVMGQVSAVHVDRRDHVGIRVGNARDGSVTAFIPDPHAPVGSPDDPTSAAEGVAADSTGAVYGAEVGQREVEKYVRPGAAR